MKKKLFLKVNLLTLAVVFILAISVFGMASLLAPAAMMNFTGSIGLAGISGDYAYQEYERSGNLEYLARAFVISADLGKDRTADERFTLLYGQEGFGAYCEAHGDIVMTDGAGTELFRAGYRGYLCGLAACVRYRLFGADDAGAAQVIEFAASETAASFPEGNPLLQLSTEAAGAGDSAFCALLLGELREGPYDAANPDLVAIIGILEKI